MDPCFHILYAKFCPYHLNVTAEIEAHQTWQRFFQSSIVQFWWACANCSLRFLFLADRSGTQWVFCCCSPSASGFNVLCVQRWYSAYLGCNEWLFELLLPLTSLTILLWPLKSTRYFHPHKCSLDIFYFWTVRKDPAGMIQWRQSFRGWRALRVSLSFSRHNKNIKMEHFFLYILSRYFIWLHKWKGFNDICASLKYENEWLIILFSSV